MALRTVGSNANNSFGGFLVGTDDVTAATLALLQDAIFTDLPMVNAALVGNTRQRLNGSYMAGRLFVPGRGELVCKYGDFIMLEPTTGWPMLVSADAIANGAFTHT